jgi:hypothetical protein
VTGTRTRTTIPARQVLTRATARSERDGHENLGFLSETHGFLPREAPRLSLPTSHRAWDETAARLPELFRTLSLRATFEAMPVLPATDEALPDDALLRAAAILGISAHAYFYADPYAPEALPASIVEPWKEVSDRLDRPGPNLSFIDLNAYNWRLRTGRLSDAMLVENLALLIPIAHALLALPFVVRAVAPVMRSIDNRLREAAMVLGASPGRAWREVDLPIVGRAFLVAAGFSFAIAVGEFGATVFVARAQFPTMPVAIFRMLGRPGAANLGQAMAMSTILMVVTTTALLLIDRLRVGQVGRF